MFSCSSMYRSCLLLLLIVPMATVMAKPMASNILESEEMKKVGQILKLFRQNIIAGFGQTGEQQQKAFSVLETGESGNGLQEGEHAKHGANNEGGHRIAELNKQNAHLLFQDDIVLSVQQAEHLLQQQQHQSNGRARRQAVSASSNYFIWENRTVPYTFDNTISEEMQELIRQALAFWADQTCLNFQEQANDNEQQQSDKTALLFFAGDGCYSSVGRQVDKSIQEISLGEGCEHFGIIAHEVAHALGFFHAHSRWDRDQFVTINQQYMDSKRADNFFKESPYTNDNMQVPYDYGSVMHYGSTSFSSQPSLQTIVALEPHNQNTMGQRLAPSFLDVLLMNKRYGCIADCEAETSAAKCENGGYPKPRDCPTCICPWGFGGQLCTERQPSTGSNAKCGKTVHANEEWTQLSAMVGRRGSRMASTELNACHFHIVAPEGKQVELQVMSVGGACQPGCFVGNTEVKTRADFTRSGFRLCCPSDLGEDGLFLRSETHLAIVSLYSRMGAQHFELQYRYV